MIFKLIQEKAAKYGLKWELLAGVVWHESGGNPWITRYEPAFYRRYIEDTPPAALPGYVPDFPPTLQTEKIQRSTSWGLGQVMGNTARLVDFDERELTKLCIPAINLEITARFLRRCVDANRNNDEEHQTRSALAKYNTGRGDHLRTGYDDRILQIIERMEYAPLSNL